MQQIAKETFTAHIYKIYCHWTGLNYIGSTTKPVKQRLKSHEYAYKYYKLGKTNYISSFDVLKNGDYDISILESVEVESINELRKIEGAYIRLLKCVNKHVAGQTHLQYVEANKEKIKIGAQKYRDINRDKLDKYLLEPVKCECGCMSTRRNIAQHRKSNKHINELLGIKLF